MPPLRIPTTTTLRVAVASALLACGAVGCGGGATGEPDRIDGVTKYDAATAARDILSDESLNKGGIAYGKSGLFVGETVAETFDGRLVWRVGFETIDGTRSDVCVWLWLAGRDGIKPDITYVLDHCQVQSGA